MVPLLVKIAAVNRLAQAALQMRRVKLDRRSLLGMALGLCSVVIAYLCIWTAMDSPDRKNDYELTGNKNEYGEYVVLVSHYCASESSYWVYSTLAGHGVLLIGGSVLAFQTRRLPGDINESRVLAILVYTQFLFLLLRTVVTLLHDAIPVTDISRCQAIIFSIDVVRWGFYAAKCHVDVFSTFSPPIFPWISVQLAAFTLCQNSVGKKSQTLP